VTFIVHFRAPRGVDAIRALRGVLKLALRRFRLRAVQVREVLDEPVTSETANRWREDMDVAAFRAMAAAMRSRQGFDGTLLKFEKGTWRAGKTGTEFTGAKLIAHVPELMWGWTKWEERKPSDYRVGLVREHFLPAKRAELGDLDPNFWGFRGSERVDPWQFGFHLSLSDPNDGQLYVYSSGTAGGKDALANLQDAFADHVEAFPAEAEKLPLICLDAGSYLHPNYGRVAVPHLDIVGWVDPPTGIKQIQPPAPPPAPGSGAAELAAIEAPIKLPNRRDEMDDSIPF
jgi:hypothetical protein